MFNGTNAQVTVPNAASLQLTTGMTLEAWVFPTTAPTGWRAVVDKNVDGYYLMASTDNGNRPGVGATWTNGNKNIFGTSVLPVNTWTHLASTYDGSTIRLFVNGVQVASRRRPAASRPRQRLQIGGDPYTAEYFQGLIDEVRVYNRALSAAEIQSDMDTPVSGDAATAVTTPPRRPRRHADRHGPRATQINLAWTAATDNVGVTGYRVERCQGAGCTNFAQIATPTATSYNDTGLTAATSYSYRVRATDAAGNLGGYSKSPRPPRRRRTPGAQRAAGAAATARARPRSTCRWTARPTTSASRAIGSSAARAPAARLRPDRTLSGTSFSDTGPDREHELQLPRARRDAAGNLSAVLERRLSDDRTRRPTPRAPSAPTGLSAERVEQRAGRPRPGPPPPTTSASPAIGSSAARVPACTTFAQIATPDRHELQRHRLAPATTLPLSACAPSTPRATSAAIRASCQRHHARGARHARRRARPPASAAVAAGQTRST